MEIKKNIVLTAIEGDAPQKAILSYYRKDNTYYFEFKGINFAPKQRILGIYTGGKLYKFNLDNKSLEFTLNDITDNNISVVVLDKQNMLRPFLWGSQLITDNDLVMSKVIEEVNIAFHNESEKEFEKSFDDFVQNEEKVTKNDFSLKNILEEESQDIESNSIIDEYQDDIDNNDSGEPKFYGMVKDQINKIIEDNITEKILENIIPDSRFVQVPKGNGESYVFGVIYESDIPRYICYGERGKFSDNRPKHLSEFYQWLPIDVNNISGDGYYMMYQDADTGKNLEMTVIE